MLTRAVLKVALPTVCACAERQESLIRRDGVALTAKQITEARQIGVLAPEKVRLKVVDRIALPLPSLLEFAGRKLGLISDSTIGMSLRYGIFIRSDHWGDRRLLIHELVHTAQYERLGGFRPFLEAYLLE